MSLHVRVFLDAVNIKVTHVVKASRTLQKKRLARSMCLIELFSYNFSKLCRLPCIGHLCHALQNVNKYTFTIKTNTNHLFGKQKDIVHRNLDHTNIHFRTVHHNLFRLAYCWPICKIQYNRYHQPIPIVVGCCCNRFLSPDSCHCHPYAWLQAIYNPFCRKT